MMKGYIKTAWMLVLITMLTGCADYIDGNYPVDKPESVSQYEYLDAYGPLKSYINRSAHPSFLLGAAVTVDEYIKKGREYVIANSNFDQLTAGNAMKYSSIVGDDGTMNLGNVSDFVSAARDGGVQIYGHTLCWHAQQNLKWLNSLIADREVPSGEWENILTNSDCESDDTSCFKITQQTDGPKDAIFSAPGTGAGGTGRAIVVTSGNDPANAWDTQFFIRAPRTFADGETFRLTMKIKASRDSRMSSQAHAEPGAYLHWSLIGDLNPTTEWQTIEKEVTVSGDQVGMQTLAFNLSEDPVATTYYFDDIVLEVQKKGEVAVPVYIFNYDFSSSSHTMIGWGNYSTREIVNGILELTNPSVVNSWEAQAGYDFADALEQGTRYYLKLKIKASKAGSINAALQNPTPPNYPGCGDFDIIQLTTEWTEQIVSTTCSGENATRMLLNYGAFDGTIYIDEIALYSEKMGNTLPLTKEEKEEILTNEMERWIRGVMNATGDYVKAWDVVNEPLQDGYPWGQRYALKSEALNNDPNESFYWQDYLGENYVRVPIKFARKYFAENGGNPDDLKLFINDYNLESDWDDNQKVKSLISWVEQWESDGETKIDGIGTQMHISYYLNPETQASKEKHIVQMLELLAATGKLIRITELDMGIVDEQGLDIKTSETTLAHKLAMSDFYKFIITKYFEIIPTNQQYGICQWCPTDSPEGSSWRAGLPVGLWDVDYSRKPAYGGFADGLAGNK